MNIFKDQNGKISSKRVFGAILAIIGTLMYIALGVVSFFKRTADPETIIRVGAMLIITGAGLLGISVIEFFNSKNSQMINEEKIEVADNFREPDFICRKCGKPFNLNEYNPEKDIYCPFCGSEQ